MQSSVAGWIKSVGKIRTYTHREQKDVLDEEKKKTENKRQQKGNKKTSECFQDSVLLWNDSVLPNKLTLAQTKPTQHATPSYAGGRLTWPWNSAFTWAPDQLRGVAERLRGWCQAGQQGWASPRTSGQEEVNTEQLCYASASSPLVAYFQWEAPHGAAEPPSCKPSASRVPPVTRICCCPSAAKISPYPLILLCPEKFTSKATAALQTGNKLQWSGESLASPALARAPASLPRGLDPDWRDKQPQFEEEGEQVFRLFVNFLKERKPLHCLWKSPFVISNTFQHRLKMECYLPPLRSHRKYQRPSVNSEHPHRITGIQSLVEY